MGAVQLGLGAAVVALLTPGLHAYGLLPSSLRRQPNARHHTQRSSARMLGDHSLRELPTARYGSSSSDASRWSGPPRTPPAARKRHTGRRVDPQRPATTPLEEPPLHTRQQLHPRQLTVLLKGCTTCRELLEVQKEHGRSFNVIHLSAFWNKLGSVYAGHKRERVYLRSRAAAASLIGAREDLMRLLPELRTRELAGVVHGMAKADIRSDAQWIRLWDHLALSASEQLASMDPQGICNTAWAFATAGHSAPSLFEAIAVDALRPDRLRAFSDQALTMTVWAFATAGATAGGRAPELFEAIAVESLPRLRHFTPQALANTAWAYSTASHESPALFDAIAAETVARARRHCRGTLMPQSIANTLWSFASAGHPAPELFGTMARAAGPLLRAFNSQELANTAYAFATAGYGDSPLLEAIAFEAAPRLDQFKHNEMSSLAWLYATTPVGGRATEVLFTALEAQVVNRVAEFSAQAMSMTVWAFATMRRNTPRMYEAIAAEAPARLGSFNGQDFANTAWAFAAAGHRAPALFVALASAISARVRREDGLHFLNAQNLANLAWAFAVLDADDGGELFASGVWQEQCAALVARDEHAFSLGLALGQLHQWVLWRDEPRGSNWGLHADAGAFDGEMGGGGRVRGRAKVVPRFRIGRRSLPPSPPPRTRASPRIASVRRACRSACVRRSAVCSPLGHFCGRR